MVAPVSVIEETETFWMSGGVISATALGTEGVSALGTEGIPELFIA